MNVEYYRDFLLQNLPNAKLASGGREIVCRCRYCPDSRDPKSAHMYISIPQSEKDVSFYNCFKCHSCGVVTYKHLIEWNIYDDRLALDLIEHNKKASVYGHNKSRMSNTHYNISSLTTTDNQTSRIKLDYINSRIGTNFTYEDLRQLKIILNLNDIIRDNNIQEYTRDPRIVEQLNNNFLGFLSIDNAFLNMRRICDGGLVDKSIDKRYINYKIFNKFDTSERFYTIPSVIDTCTANRVKIHIAEGPFDILSIYQNVRHREPGIYTSIAGSGYKGIALYFLEQYKLPYSELHYYPDNDQFGNTVNIQKIADYFKPLNIPIYLHRNTYPNEKDFGVHPSHIIESIQQL